MTPFDPNESRWQEYRQSLLRNVVRMHAYWAMKRFDPQGLPMFVTLFALWEPQATLNRATLSRMIPLYRLCHCLYHFLNRNGPDASPSQDWIERVWKGDEPFIPEEWEVREEIVPYRVGWPSLVCPDEHQKILTAIARRAVGTSPGWRRAVNQASLAAISYLPLLIIGEQGTGKLLLAQLIHHHSKGSRFSPILIDCRRAGKRFKTNIVSDRLGIAEIINAHSPSPFVTLILIEVSQLSTEVQRELLSLIEREIMAIGAGKGGGIGLRVIGLSNQPLEPLVDRGMFNLDLYMLLSALCINLPPFRERAEDIPLIVRRFNSQLRRAYGITAPIKMSRAALSSLKNHTWPGNGDELWEVLIRAFHLAQGGPIEPYHLKLKKVFPFNRPLTRQNLPYRLMQQLGNWSLIPGSLPRLARFLWSEQKAITAEKYAQNFSCSLPKAEKDLETLSRVGIISLAMPYPEPTYQLNSDPH